MKDHSAVHSLDLIFEWNQTPEEVKEFWRQRMASAPKEVQEALLEFFASYPTEIDRFTRLNRKKEAVLAGADPTPWSEIITEETGYLRSLIPPDK